MHDSKYQKAHALTGYIAIGFSLLGAAAVWGRTSTVVESTQIAVNAQNVQIAANTLRIAVESQKLDDIIQRLERIEGKQDDAANKAH